jgi:hypothetical protein
MKPSSDVQITRALMEAIRNRVIAVHDAHNFPHNGLTVKQTYNGLISITNPSIPSPPPHVLNAALRAELMELLEDWKHHENRSQSHDIRNCD